MNAITGSVIGTEKRTKLSEPSVREGCLLPLQQCSEHP